MAILTDRKARAIKPDDDALPHGGVPGLTLLPLKTAGHGQWRLRYVSPTTAKRRTMVLGSYPAVTIADATRLGTAAREAIARGLDPLEIRAEEAAKAAEDVPQTPTFESAARQLHAELSPGWRNAKHAKQWLATLEQYAFPKLGQKSIDTLKPADFAEVLRPIWLEKPETASRLKQRCHAVMAWAWAHEFVQGNPLDVVAKLLPQQAAVVQHQPAMPWALIPEFWAAQLASWPPGECARALLAWILLTGCRSGEARGATWSEIDFDARVWVIPPERMKTRQPHRVPLSRQALDVLERQRGLHDELIFPSPTGKLASDMTITALLRRIKAPSDLPDRPATAHGFRSSFRDWCSQHGYRRDLAERALAHVIVSKVEAAYHRTDLLEERRPMMSAWADYCTGATVDTKKK